MAPNSRADAPLKNEEENDQPMRSLVSAIPGIAHYSFVLILRSRRGLVEGGARPARGVDGTDRGRTEEVGRGAERHRDDEKGRSGQPPDC